MKIKYYTSGDRLFARCPVHRGDNHSAFNIIIDPSSSNYGWWYCNTKVCHREFNNDIVGLIQGIQNFSYGDSVKYLEDLTKDVTLDISIKEKIKLDSVVNFFSKTKKEDSFSIDRDYVRSHLRYPAQYLVTRGFSESVLDEFDIGFCDNPNKEMYNRVVFPVYDETGHSIIGCVGRAVSDSAERWKNSKGFNKSNYLYGYWKAYKHIKKCGSVVLVEGQGDVLKLYSSGIVNSVGLFGCDLNDSQEFLLQKSGAFNIILALDNDEAGKKAREKIREKSSCFFNIIDVEIPKKDLGEMTVQEIDETIKPQIRKYLC